jgi:flagellar protein FliS
MNAMVRQRFLQQYAQTNVQTGVENATPHRLIQMLFEGALDRLAQTKGAIQRRDYETKSKVLNKAMQIIAGLRSCVDLDSGKEVAENLDALYDFMLRRLVSASARNDLDILDEVAALIRTIKSGWDEMPEKFRVMSKVELEKLKTEGDGLKAA